MGKLRLWHKTFLRAGLLLGLLVGRAQALDPAFTNDGGGSTREIKVCVLMLKANQWENSEPFVLPALSGLSGISAVDGLRPSNWQLSNPLAMPYVTQDLANLWDPAYNGAVSFDGLTAQVTNDGITAYGWSGFTNSEYYKGWPPNSGGPNYYKAHADPQILGEYGPGGTKQALPPVGQPLPRTHPAYWEVPLTPRTVTQLANFDVVLLNTQRNLTFTSQELDLLRQFLDLGGTLYMENSHGLRIEVGAADKTTLPTDQEFLLPVQFCDGFPYSNATNNTRPDGYPLNNAPPNGVAPVTPPAWTAPNLNHPLLTAVQTIGASEVGSLGDVLSAEQLILNRGSGAYLAEQVLRVNYAENWTDFSGQKDAAVAVVRMGSGKLILSGIDIMEDVHKVGYTGSNTGAYLPDVKFMLNVLGWHSSFGGNRRGGPTNKGILSSTTVSNLTPKFVWNAPSSGLTAAGTNLGDGSIQTSGYGALDTDMNAGLKEPLCAANGLVYLQCQSGGNYFLVAIDSAPSADRDGDGAADDGVPDYATGAPFDTIWVQPLSAPICGATVASVARDPDKSAVDLLLATQVIGGAVRLTAFAAGADRTRATATATAFGGGGFVNLPAVGLDPALVGAPVVYGDTVYVTTSYCPPSASETGGWTRVYAVRAVPDPATSAIAGALKWSFPDFTYGGENVDTAYGLWTSTPSKRAYLMAEALKQVELQLHPSFGGPADTLATHGGPGMQLALGDTTRLTSVVGLVTDQRTGLTAPTVFIGRANGDCWAVTADAQSMGWRINADVDLAPAATPTVTIGGNVLNRITTANPTDGCEWRQVKDISGNVVAVDVLMRGTAVGFYRDAQVYADAVLSYTVAGQAITDRRKVFPRQRLLRANRDSGYEPAVNGSMELLANGNAAPMLLDNETLVGVSSALWSANTLSGTPVGNALSSGPVVFYQAGGDSLQLGDPNPNNYETVRWQFDADSVLGGSHFGAYGSPVKYGNSIVVAGRVVNGSFAPQSGGIIALDANPGFSMALRGTAPNRDRRHYLVDADPTTFAAGSNNLAAYPASGPSATNLRAHVIDPSQYTLDFASATLSLRPDLAHLTRFAQPAQADMPTSRRPLYGRPLWLVEDNGDGLFNEPAGFVYGVYIPVPVRWTYLPGEVVIDSPGVPSAITVTDANGGGPLTPTINASQPQVMTFAAGDWGKTAWVRFTCNGSTYTHKYTIGGRLPALSFSPVVAGDRLYVSGTVAGTGAATALAVNGVGTGGLLSFRFGQEDRVVEMTSLRPDSVTGWSNVAQSTVDASYVRGTPLPTDDGVYVSFNMVQGANVLNALYGIGGSQLLVTESMRLSRLDFSGGVRWQLTGVRVQNGAARPSQAVVYNPPPSELLTSALNRPSRAYNLTGDQVLVVDTGNDRVVQATSTGAAVWPFDTRLNGAQLVYWGLRDFGLNRPSDAGRFQAVLPWPAATPDPAATRDLTVVADRGNRRLLLVSSHDRAQGSGTQTYYDALAGQTVDSAGGHGIPLTAPQVYNPVTKQWVELPFAEVQVWNPGTSPAEPTNAGEAANTGDALDSYVVARVDGYDQLFNVDLFAAHDGKIDANNDGQADGVKLSLASMTDRWAKDMSFRGLRSFSRFKVGNRMFLAVVCADPAGGSRVCVYELSTTLIASAANGLVGTYLKWPTGLTGPWTFTKSDYHDLVYDNAANDSYYERAGVGQTQRDNWWNSGDKGFNPTSISRLASDNLLALVNGAANSVNQTASNSEVLLVRFDPANLANKRVETMLPDLSTTRTYPASAGATQRRPSTGSYPVSSPVYAAQ